MARKTRDYVAEERRRNELAAARGYRNRYEQRKIAKVRNVSEKTSRDVLDTAPITRRVVRTAVREASRWASYRALYPNVLQRNERNAELFLSGFGTMGKTGIRNRRGGFVANRQQVADRQRFERMVAKESLLKFGEVYDIGKDWWSLWREEYQANYL